MNGERPGRSKPRVVLVGGYPPPYGGITVHIRRLCRALSEDYHVSVVDLFAPRDLPCEAEFVHRCGNDVPFGIVRAIRRLRSSDADVVHVHVSALRRFARGGALLMAAVPRSASTVLTVHSGSFGRDSDNKGSPRSLARLFARFDRIVAVNQQQADQIVRLGIPQNRIHVVPAFLPPSPSPDTKIKESIDRLRVSGDEKVVLMSGYGLPYYGYDTLVNALKILPADQRPPAIVCDYGAIDDAYMDSIKSRMSETTRAIFFRDLAPPVFAYLMSLCDVYVRATDRDGDAVAVREAAFLGVQILASDAVPRPEGVVLFKTNDPKSLKENLVRLLSEPELGRPQLDWYAGAQSMLELYREVVAR